MSGMPLIEKVVPLEPVNQLAALVTSESSDLRPVSRSKDKRVFEEQPPIFHFRPNHRDRGDITGMKAGNLIVIGFFSGKSHRNRWVVRCSCGLYEIRQARTIFHGAKLPMSEYYEHGGEKLHNCAECSLTIQLRRKARKMAFK